MTQAGGTRPGAGRKGYSDKTKIRRPRSIRFSDAEWEQLDQQAKQAGFGEISNYIRALAKLNLDTIKKQAEPGGQSR